MMLTTFYLLTTLAYLASAGLYALHFAQERWELRAWHYYERAAVFVLHAVYLILLGKAYGELPLASYNFLSLTALALAVVHTGVEARFHTRQTGAFMFALAFALQVASWPSISHHPEPHPLLRNPIFGVHVIAAVLGYVGFLVSALYGTLYLIQYRLLKARQTGLWSRRIPPLDLLSSMNLHAALTGFVFLTAAIILGIGLSRRLQVDFLKDPKTIQTIGAWLVYGSILGAAWAWKWRGRRLAGLSILGFVLVAVSAVLVLASFFDTFHRFS